MDAIDLSQFTSLVEHGKALEPPEGGERARRAAARARNARNTAAVATAAPASGSNNSEIVATSTVASGSQGMGTASAPGQGGIGDHDGTGGPAFKRRRGSVSPPPSSPKKRLKQEAIEAMKQVRAVAVLAAVVRSSGKDRRLSW